MTLTEENLLLFGVAQSALVTDTTVLFLKRAQICLQMWCLRDSANKCYFQIQFSS